MRDILNYSHQAPYPLTSAPSVAPGGQFFFLLLVFILPFQHVTFLDTNLFGIQGLKPFNLLSAAVLTYLVFQGALLHARDRIERRSLQIFLLYFATFTIAVFRSIPNAPLFHDRFPAAFPASYLDYILSCWIVPAFYVLLFLFTLKRMRTFQALERITTVICFSILLLSTAFIIIVLMNPSALEGSRDEIADLTSGSRAPMVDLCDTYFGIHYNTIGTIYICTAPLLLYKVLTRSSLWIVPLGLSLVAILLLESRSALVTVALSYCLFLIQRRRFAILVFGTAVVGIASVLSIGPTIVALFSIGFGDSSGFSANSLLTGRLDLIWAPLLDEWTSNISLFLFGAGRYGMVTSELWYTGALIQTGHAHNAIINFFLDCGVLLSGVLVIFLLVGITTAWRVGRILDSDLYWALFACIFGFGIGMMTEREVFPTDDNMYAYLIIAMMINLARLRYLARPKTNCDDLLPGMVAAQAPG